MISRATVSLGIFLLAIWVGLAAHSQEPVRIVDIRVGKHADYDRLVIELEQRVTVRIARTTQDGRYVLELDARPLLPNQTLETPFKHMGTVVIDRVPAGSPPGVCSMMIRPTRVPIIPKAGAVAAMFLRMSDRTMVRWNLPSAAAISIVRTSSPW